MTIDPCCANCDSSRYDDDGGIGITYKLHRTNTQPPPVRSNNQEVARKNKAARENLAKDIPTLNPGNHVVISGMTQGAVSNLIAGISNRIELPCHLVVRTIGENQIGIFAV